MITLNKFLGCLKLEFGGIILGWINIFASIVATYFVITNFGDRALHLIGLLIATIINGIISYFLILGTRRRNHIMTQPFRILCYLELVAITLSIVLMIARLKSKYEQNVLFYHLFLGLFVLVIEFYVLLVVESLHKKFRDEKFHHGGFIMPR